MAGFRISRKWAQDQGGRCSRLVFARRNVETEDECSYYGRGPLSFRKRIETSQTLARLIAAVAGSYLAFCHRTTKWNVEGLDDLRSALADGPVVLVLWHSRCLYAGKHWPKKYGSLSTLYNRSPVGRLAGALHRREGLQPMEMSQRLSNQVASRKILKRAMAGVSIGLTADGPIGPALEVKDAPLDWARATGAPVFCYAFSKMRRRRLKSWDQMLVPKPFGKGAYVFQRFEGTVPRKMDAEAREVLRAQMRTFMLNATARADALAGLPPGA
jgi:lysophospholipid acyltransferase (LPLAT)-like uncharacterized protein